MLDIVHAESWHGLFNETRQKYCAYQILQITPPPIHAKPSLSIYGMGKCTTNDKNLGCERLVILHVHVLKTVDNEVDNEVTH